MSGTEWKPVAIPPNAECKPRDSDDVDELAGWYLDALVDRANVELATHDPTRVEIAAAELDQALLLARAPERRDQRNDIARLQGDVEYWRASAKLASAQTALLDAAKQFDAAANKRPRHVADASAWSAFVRKLAEQLKGGPNGPDLPVTAPERSAAGAVAGDRRDRIAGHRDAGRAATDGARRRPLSSTLVHPVVACCCDSCAASSHGCGGASRSCSCSPAVASPTVAVAGRARRPWPRTLPWRPRRAPAKRASVGSAGSGSDVDDAARAAQAAYRAAMRAGRKATDAARYDEAIDAFNDALKVRPNDARAISERGFAYLLDGSLLGAEEDLDRAAGLTKDKKLLSSIWFNRGLVEDKRHEAENADRRLLHRQPAAPDGCSAGQARRPNGVPGACRAHRHPRQQRLRAPERPGRRRQAGSRCSRCSPTWSSSTAPRRAPKRRRTTPSTPSPTLPTIASTGEAGQGRADFIVVKQDAGLRAYPLGFDDGGRCPGYTAFEIVKVAGTVVLVHGTVLSEGGMTDMCLSGSGELAECTGGSGEEPHGEACFSPDPRVYDIAIDTATDHRLVITRPKPTEETAATTVNVALTGSGLAVSGVTCEPDARPAVISSP